MKAGRQDKKEGRKANQRAIPTTPWAISAFAANTETAAKFVAGYQGGFSKGYKAGFAEEKIDKDAAQKAKEQINSRRKKPESKKAETKKTETKKATTQAAPRPKRKTKEDEERRKIRNQTSRRHQTDE
jgi:hypothetical protein